MTLSNGKFYQDGKEIPLEAGNKEQIKLMQTQNNNLKKLKSIETLQVKIQEAFKEFQSLNGQVLFINSLRETLHKVSPFKRQRNAFTI